MKRPTPQAEIEAISIAAARWVARRDAGLTPGAQGEFERWLAADPRHLVALEHYGSTWSVFDRAQGTGAKEAVLHQMQMRARRRRHRRMQIGGAALLLIVLLAVVWRQPRLRELPQGVALLEPERRTLPDGSIAELTPGSRIEVHFDAGARSVELLRGGAHFQVAKNQARPFIVRAGAVQARAVGTAFAVELLRGNVEVLVTEGHVAVEKTPAPAPAALAANPPASEFLATLGAGERISVAITPQAVAPPVVVAVSSIELNERLAWRVPRLEFSGTPLAEAVALMNRAGGRRIRLSLDPASPGLAEEPVSGLFRTDNAEAFVHVLELSMGVRAERIGENEIVLHRAK